MQLRLGLVTVPAEARTVLASAGTVTKPENPPTQKIELSEICKLVKREIRKDCRAYEEKKVCEIIEEFWSTRKMWRDLNRGKIMISELVDEEGKIITGREKIPEETIRFYKELYKTKTKNNTDNEQ